MISLALWVWTPPAAAAAPIVPGFVPGADFTDARNSGYAVLITGL